MNHWFLLILILVYVAILAHHAWVGRKRTRGVADFYVGGRSMGGVAIGLSFFATFSSTNSFVGFSGQSYVYGLPWLLLTPFLVVFSLVSWLWVAPRLHRFTTSLDSLTLPDFFGFRFCSSAVRLQAALIVIFASLFYMTAIFKGIGNLLEAFLQVPYWLAIIMVFFIVVGYTAAGGFISVVKTDVVQGYLMILGAFLLFGVTVRAAGGLGALWSVRDLPDGARLFSWDAGVPFPMLLGILFAGSFKFVVEPRQLSRFYALKDLQAVRRGMWVSTAAFLVVYSMLTPIGLYARHLVEGIQDSDHVVPSILTDPAIFPPLVSGFLLLVMVAAAMSSLDSVLLVVASTFQRDVVGLWKASRSEKAAIVQTGFWVALFALITTLIALRPPGGIVKLTIFSGSLYAACFFPALIFGLYWRGGNGTAVSASFLAGVLCLLLWAPLTPWPSVHEVFPSLLLSTLTYLAVARLTPPVPSQLFGS